MKWSCNIPDFAAALANPIAYQSALEKHAEQLAVLEEDFDAPVRKSERVGNHFQITPKFDLIRFIIGIKLLPITNATQRR